MRFPLVLMDERRDCLQCIKEGKKSKMKIYQVNFQQAVCMCEECGDLFCNDDGNAVMERNIDDMPFTKEELQAKGLPEELLSYFPTMKLPLVDMIARVLNYRWQKEKDSVWQEFKSLNSEFTKIKIDEVATESNSKIISDLSDLNNEQVDRIMTVLDEIEEKRIKRLDESSETEKFRDSEDVKKEFFGKYGPGPKAIAKERIAEKRNTHIRSMFKKNKDRLARLKVANQMSLIKTLEKKAGGDKNKSIVMQPYVFKNLSDDKDPKCKVSFSVDGQDCSFYVNTQE